MELFSYNNLWYGIPLYVEYQEEEYEYEDSRRVTSRVARRGQRNAPVCRGRMPKVYRDNEAYRRNPRAKTVVYYAQKFV